MEALTKFKATDGTEWNSEADCLKRDALDAEVRAIEEAIGPVVRDGRRHVDPSVVALAKVGVVNLCRREFPSQQVFQHDAKDIHPMSFAGRFLSDVGGPLNRVWFRFACINGEWEYEQPYYALNPDKFKE